MGGRMFGRAARSEAIEREAIEAGETVLSVVPSDPNHGAWPTTDAPWVWSPDTRVLPGVEGQVVVGFDLAAGAADNTVTVIVEENGYWTIPEVERRRAELGNWDMSALFEEHWQPSEVTLALLRRTRPHPNRMADNDEARAEHGQALLERLRANGWHAEHSPPDALREASARRVNQMIRDYGFMLDDTGDRYTAPEILDIDPSPEWWEAARQRIAAGGPGSSPGEMGAALRDEQRRLAAEAGQLPGQTRMPLDGAYELDAFTRMAYPEAVAEFLNTMAIPSGGHDPATCLLCQATGPQAREMRQRTRDAAFLRHTGRVPEGRPSTPRWAQGHGHPGGAFDDGYSGDAHRMTFAEPDEPLDPESIEFEARMRSLDDEISSAAARMLAGS